eukprot:790687-Pyramimonas_sp.AAC.1
MHVGSYFEPPSAILSRLGGRLGASGAHLKPSWAILGALTDRDPPPKELQGREGEGAHLRREEGFGRGSNNLVRPPAPRG